VRDEAAEVGGDVDEEVTPGVDWVMGWVNVEHAAVRSNGKLMLVQ
jgi:hypothetical protein